MTLFLVINHKLCYFCYIQEHSHHIILFHILVTKSTKSFIAAKTAFHHCTLLFITAHFVHHCTLKQALMMIISSWGKPFGGDGDEWI